MRTSLLLFLLFFTIRAKLVAQTCGTAGYSYAYWYNGIPSSLVTNILPGPDNTLLVFGNFQLNYQLPTANFDMYITKINSRGTPLQTQTFNYNTDVFIYDACQNPGGGYFTAGLTVGPTTGKVPWVAKFDANANLVWSQGMSTPSGNFYQVVATEDGGCAAVGALADSSQLNTRGNVVRPYNHAIVFKFDGNGKMLWGQDFYTAQAVEQAFAVLGMKDGSVVVTGVKNNGSVTNPGEDNFIMKLGKDDGHIIWQKATRTSFGYIAETADGNLLFRESNFLYFVNSADGTPTSAIRFDLPVEYDNADNFQYGGVFADGGSLYFDLLNTGNVLLFKMYGYDSIAWVTRVPASNGFGNNSDPVAALIDQGNGQSQIYLTGGLSSQGLAIQDSSTVEQNTFLYKLDINGQSLCTNKVTVPVSFSNVLLPELTDFTWYGSGNVSLTKGMPLSVGGQVPHSGSYCARDSCCHDTTVAVSDSMCVGSTYALPDGTLATAQGLYSAVLKRVSGCDSIVLVNLTVSAPAKPNLGDDTCLKGSSAIILKANAPLAKSYLWQDGSTDSVYSVTQAGRYWVQARNLCGTFADTAVIYPQCNLPVYVPSAFTPNGDGKNDIFRIADIKHQKLLDFSIYNRWGALVFRTENAEAGWDGSLNGQQAAPGVFVYLIHYVDLNGAAHYMKGTVVLVR